MASSGNPFAFRKSRLDAMKQLKPKARQEAERKRVESSLATECPSCHKQHAPGVVEGNRQVCPQCGHHFKMAADERLALVFDGGAYTELDAGLVGTNPLKFPGYSKKVADNAKKTGLSEAAVCAEGAIGGVRCVVCVLDSRFLMGSMGEAVGEKITRAVEHATDRRLPLIIFSASGGARMQEGIYSLMQMAKTSAAIARHDEAGLLFISVMTDPTTGGVTASFASLGDIIIAEPGALIGFAGPRVIEQTIRQQLPDGFQRAEYLLDHGFLDAIVPRDELVAWLRSVLAMHVQAAPVLVDPQPVILSEAKDLLASAQGQHEDPSPKAQDDKSGAAQDDKSGAPQNDARVSAGNDTRDAADGAAHLSRQGRDASGTDSKDSPTASQAASHARQGASTLAQSASNAASAMAKGMRTMWSNVSMPPHKRVELARSPERPNADYFIDALFSDFTEFHGDRFDSDDRSIRGGVALFHDVPVTVIAQCKGKTLEDNIERNFGMPNPQGYRKAQRLARQAEKFGRPVITIVDTPGAYPGLEAEQKGQGEAIARSIELFSTLKVPVIAIFIGEGGSGGALALGVANSVIMLENAIYSILSPEGFAAILWKDSSRAKDAAAVMKLTAADIVAAGVADEVIPEGDEPLRMPCPGVVAQIDAVLASHILELAPLPGDELARRRYEKFRAIGRGTEVG